MAACCWGTSKLGICLSLSYEWRKKHPAGSLSIPQAHMTVDTYAYSHARTFCLRVADRCLPPGSLFAVPSCNTCSHCFSLSRLKPCAYTFHCTHEGTRNCKRCIYIMELMVDLLLFFFFSFHQAIKKHSKIEVKGPELRGALAECSPRALLALHHCGCP